jgi:hypothetical protein
MRLRHGEKKMQKLAKARSYKEYVNLPKKDRTQFGFWYLVPEMLSPEDWDAVEVHFKIEYPIQYRLREFIDSVCIQMYRFKHWWHENVVCRIKPKNRWAAKLIPHTWIDKPELIEVFLFECVVHYVEIEVKRYDHIDWEDEYMAEIWQRIQKCYTYITVDLPAIKKQQERLWKIAYPPCVGERLMTFPDQKAAQNKCIELDETIETTTKKILKEIVDLKDYLWT